MAFFVEYSMVTVDLSEERICNGVFEHQGSSSNQPEEVRVVLEGFDFR